MALADAQLDDLGYSEEEQKRKAAIPPAPPVRPEAGVPIGPGPSVSSRYAMAPPVKPPTGPYRLDQPGDVTPGIGIARGELAGRPPDLGVPSGPTLPQAPPVKAPGYAERFAGLQAEKPQRDDPAFKVPGWKKGLGALSAIAAGTGNRNINAGELYSSVANAPYNRAEQAWEQKGAGLEKEAKMAEAEQRMKQLDMVPVKVPWSDQPIFVQQKDVAQIERTIGTGANQEKVTGQKTASAEKIAGGKEASAEKIAGGKEASTEKIAGERNVTAKGIAHERAVTAERIAMARNLTSTENARIRAAAANDPDKLTNTMKTMKQQAQATLPGIDRALDETERMAQKLGPVEGRWNKFMTSDVGRADKEFAHYLDEIGMVSSAVTLAHARGRMSNELFEHFQKMFDAGKQSPENMIAALDVAKEWLSDYAKMGETPPTATPTPTAPAKPSGITIKRDANGRIIGVE